MFLENSNNGLVYMTSTAIGCKHAFTTRFGGVSTGHLESLNLSENMGDDISNVMENYARLGNIFGVSKDGFAISKQVHGTDVRVVDENDRHTVGVPVPYRVDGLVTNREKLPIMVFAADCIPVLLSDETNRVIGAVHCGWRSSVSDILSVVVEKMVNLGADTKSIKVAIGPSIGFDHFEVGPEVVEAAGEYLKEDLTDFIINKENEKFLMDLRGINKRRLEKLGILSDNIDVSDECTMCKPEKYWSYRYTKGVRGSQGAAIMLE